MQYWKKPSARYIDDFFSARQGDADDEWPGWRYKGEYKLDTKFSFAVAAAFIGGLSYSADHENANAGLTQTLGFFDADYAMVGYEKAIEQLEPNDERAEYLFQCLAKSQHARASELLTKAAWRFF